MNEVQRPRIQFGLRTLIEMITVVAFILALIYGKSNWGSGSRYQVQTTGLEKGTIVTDVFDSQTGKLWRLYAGEGEWHQVGSPVPEN